MRKARGRSERIQGEQSCGRPTDFTADRPPDGASAAEPGVDTAPHGWKRRRLWWALLSAPVPLLVVVWAAVVIYGRTVAMPVSDPRPAVASAVRRQILADLPPGSTDAQIVQWLEANCSWYRRTVINNKKGLRHEYAQGLFCEDGDIFYEGTMPWRGQWPDTGRINMSLYLDAKGKIQGVGASLELDRY